MEFRILLEWTAGLELTTLKMLELMNELEEKFKSKEYGPTLLHIHPMLIGRYVTFEPRYQYSKGKKRLVYDVVLDESELAQSDIKTQKNIVKSRLVGDSKRVMDRYRFENFDADTFLHDLQEALDDSSW